MKSYFEQMKNKKIEDYQDGKVSVTHKAAICANCHTIFSIPVNEQKKLCPLCEKVTRT